MKQMKRLFVGTVIVLAAATSAPAQSAAPAADTALSLMANSGFEQGLEGWKFSNGWSGMKDDLRAKVIEIRTDGAQAGGKYLRVTNEQKSGFYGVEQPLKFEANTVYTISWWSRGKSSTGGHEQGANRLRFWGYGGPEYGDDVPYTTKEWTYHEARIYATQNGSGGVSLWVWPNGYCDIDNLTIRKSFVRSEKAAYRPGDTAAFTFSLPATAGQQATIAWRLTDSDGQLMQKGELKGIGPMTQQATAKLDRAGYFTMQTTTTIGPARFHDQAAIVATSPATGMEAVKREWQTP